MPLIIIVVNPYRFILCVSWAIVKIGVANALNTYLWSRNLRFMVGKYQRYGPSFQRDMAQLELATRCL